MYYVKLDIEDNPEDNAQFTFETFKELTLFIKVCFANNYGVIISEE